MKKRHVTITIKSTAREYVTYSKELTGIPHLIGLLRSIIIKTTSVECQNQKYCQEGPQSRTYGVSQTKLHPESQSNELQRGITDKNAVRE